VDLNELPIVSIFQRWNVLSLRYFNPVGAHESGQIGEHPNGEPQNLMPYISLVAVRKLNYLKVFGNDYDTPDGTCVRDFIHISDLADGHLAALNKLQSEDIHGFKAYNLATGFGTSVLDLVNNFSNICGRTISFQYAPRRRGDVATLFASCEKAEKELEVKAKKGLKEMCKSAWNWQKNNPNGYETSDVTLDIE
jgi:UDP-glucose 4-epimerase